MDKPTIARLYGSGFISAQDATKAGSALIGCTSWASLLREAIKAAGIFIYYSIWRDQIKKQMELDGQELHQIIHNQNEIDNEIID